MIIVSKKTLLAVWQDIKKYVMNVSLDNFGIHPNVHFWEIMSQCKYMLSLDSNLKMLISQTLSYTILISFFLYFLG
jgi:hypothetical protein